MQENNNNNQSLLIAKELNKLGNLLTLNVTELLNEIDAYTDNYFDETFIAPNIKNDKDGTMTKKAIQRGETIFDKIMESVMRNEIVGKMENIVENVLIEFTNKMKELKENIQQEKNKLIETNNEVLDNLQKLENKKFNKSLKSFEKDEMKTKFRNTMKESMKTTIKSFKRKTIEEEQQEIKQKEIFKQGNNVMTLEEMKQLEELTDLPIDSIVYDSNTEGIENCGYQGSTFQNNVLNKEVKY